MKKLFLFSLALMLLLPASMQAAVFAGEEEYTLPRSEVITENFYVGGAVVNLSGEMQQDVHAAGAAVIITGDIGEDLTAAASSIDVLGEVGDDLRVAGSKVSIGESVGGDVVAAGALVHILSDVIVVGDVMANGAKVIIDGTLEADLEANGAEVNINGIIAGDVVVRAEKVTLGPKARIEGALSYTAPEEVIMGEGAEILGEVTYTEGTAPNIEVQIASSLEAFLIAFGALKFIGYLIAALLAVMVLKKKSRRVVEETISTFWPDVLRGLIFSIIVPIVGLVLTLSLVGTIVGLVLWTIFVLSALVAGIYAGPVLGAWVFKIAGKKETLRVDWLSVLVGVVLITVLALIPVVGWIGVCLLFLATMGALLNLFIKHFWSQR